MTGGADDARLLCDRMLVRLGRYLRAAGYDTEIVRPGDSDADIVARMEAERRRLLTCDRWLAVLAGRRGQAVLLPANGLDEAARTLAARHGIDWRRDPFSRCLVDNAPVVAAGPEDRARLPERARAVGGPVTLCPECGRLYWPGSHVRRMETRLKGWWAAAGATGCFGDGPGLR